MKKIFLSCKFIYNKDEDYSITTNNINENNNSILSQNNKNNNNNLSVLDYILLYFLKDHKFYLLCQNHN